MSELTRCPEGNKNWEQFINIMRGKSLMVTDAAEKAALMDIFRYIDILEDALDECDESDFFGTEGWRHGVLGEDSE